MKLIPALLFAVLLALPISKAAQAQSLLQMEDAAQAMMTQALEAAIDDFGRMEGRKIEITEFVCPHAMIAMAAVGSGATDLETGQKMMLAGLVEDQANLMSSRILGGPAIDLTKGTGVSLSFELARGVEPDILIGMAKMGIEAMQ